MNMEDLYKAEFKFENIRGIFQPLIENLFMEHRSRAVELFNANIDRVNSDWEKTGKPFAYGEYFEDVNPEYVKAIKDAIQPIFDRELNPKLLVRYEIDEYGDIIGRVGHTGKITLTLKKVSV